MHETIKELDRMLTRQNWPAGETPAEKLARIDARGAETIRSFPTLYPHIEPRDLAIGVLTSLLLEHGYVLTVEAFHVACHLKAKPYVPDSGPIYNGIEATAKAVTK